MDSRWSGASFSLVGVNFTASDVEMPFWFPGSGPYAEQLHAVQNVGADTPLTEVRLVIPGNET